MGRVFLWTDDKLNCRFGVYTIHIEDDGRYSASLRRADAMESHGTAVTAYIGTYAEVKAKVEAFLIEFE